jgi:hypothetical protein
LSTKAPAGYEPKFAVRTQLLNGGKLYGGKQQGRDVQAVAEARSVHDFQRAGEIGK